MDCVGLTKRAAAGNNVVYTLGESVRRNRMALAHHGWLRFGAVPSPAMGQSGRTNQLE